MSALDTMLSALSNQTLGVVRADLLATVEHLTAYAPELTGFIGLTRDLVDAVDFELKSRPQASADAVGSSTSCEPVPPNVWQYA
jgi:hypothetical protein